MKSHSYVLLFCLMSLFAEYCLAAEPLTVLSWNIDTNIGRTEEGFARDAFPELRVNERMPKIINVLENMISEHTPDIIQLQEARCFDTKFGDRVDSISPLVTLLAERGYAVNAAKYNPSERAFSYIEAIKKSSLQILKCEASPGLKAGACAL